MRQAVFNPDQLISGPLQVVTDTGIIAKAGILKRGTILGMVTASGEYVISKKMQQTAVKSRVQFWLMMSIPRLML